MIKAIKQFFEKHKTLGEIARFLIVGGLATVIDFFCMSLFIYIFNAPRYDNSLINVFLSRGEASVWSVVVGTGVGFTISLIFNYMLSVLFVFSNNTFAKTPKGAIAFAVLSACGLGIHTLFMYVGYDLLHINEWVVKVTLTLVVMVFNFTTRKFLVFKKDNAQTNNPENVSNEQEV